MIILLISDCLTWLFQFFTSVWTLLDNNFIVTGVSFVGFICVCYILYAVIDRFYPKV